jgi:hypothetical protein
MSSHGIITSCDRNSRNFIRVCTSAALSVERVAASAPRSSRAGSASVVSSSEHAAVKPWIACRTRLLLRNSSGNVSIRAWWTESQDGRNTAVPTNCALLRSWICRCYWAPVPRCACRASGSVSGRIRTNFTCSRSIGSVRAAVACWAACAVCQA